MKGLESMADCNKVDKIRVVVKHFVRLGSCRHKVINHMKLNVDYKELKKLKETEKKSQIEAMRSSKSERHYIEVEIEKG